MTETGSPDGPTSTFDAQSLFDEDYLYFYATRLADPRSDAQTQLIWELLELEPGMAVLDLACGHGRIANRLAARGCRLTGLDTTSLFLEHARRDAAERGVDVDYVEGDVRALPWMEHFDRIISWSTSFGYFDDTANRQVLAHIARALKPGGRVVLDLNNRDWLVREFQSALVVERDGSMLIDRNRLEPLTGRIITERTVIRGGKTRRILFFVRLFTFTELRDWLLAAGFVRVDGCGQGGEPLSSASPRLIVVAYR
ncbi:class I SAM-dependent methyltransferase [Frankia sp. AiPs1]|uniref:class I SAM-dependent methyltransferase n=1 Tax=Frankia sp. AiPs1 TaxID=573493 RepID=UPI002042FB8C|nr:class I SAM-dependent methyltransferase [Frankia sp. AiPs1]MCM3922691.1 class I SAM-dependent methyltransferase [Frankia sp. AiPs1]